MPPDALRTPPPPAPSRQHASTAISVILFIAAIGGIAAFVTIGRVVDSPFRSRFVRPAPAPTPEPVRTGTLRIRVVNAAGEPVDGASVHIANATTNPPIALLLPSDVHGEATATNLPAPADGYTILVTKAGYSSDQAHAPNAEYPRPFQPPLALTPGTTTTATFTIDRLGGFALTFLHEGTRRPFRELTTFVLSGNTGIAAVPNPTPPPDELLILKAPPQSFTTSAGAITIRDLPWDTYRFTPAMAAFDLASTDPPLPLPLAPGTVVPVTVTFAPHAAHALHILVRDAAGAPAPNARVVVARAGSPTRTGRTHAHGQVFLTPLTADPATVTVTCADGSSATAQLTIAGRTALELRCSNGTENGAP